MRINALRATLATVCAFALLLSAGCGGDSKPEPAKGEPTAGPAKVELGAQAETAEDLKKFMNETLAAVNDDAKIKALCASMVVPDFEKFFVETFGAEKGKAVAAEYAAGTKSLGEQLPALFRRVSQKGQTDINIRKLTDPEGKGPTGLQADALKAMKKKIALYSVRFVKPGEKYGMHLWSFVHLDGRFRLAGKMRTLMK